MESESMAQTDVGEEEEAESILKMPVEDTIWVIKLSREDSRASVEMTIRNLTSGCFVGSYSVDQEVAPPDELFVLRGILNCVMQPKHGKPRRPRSITFEPSSEVLVGRFSRYGFECVENASSGTHNVERIFAAMRTCSSCRMRGEERLFLVCPQCRVAFYCSDECLVADMRNDGEHSHSHWCDKMASYAAESCKLADFPFTYAGVTTDDDFTSFDYHEFLRSEGVLHQGYWRREVRICRECPHVLSAGRARDVPYGALDDDYLEWVLPSESVALESPIGDTSDAPLENWASYYKFIGLRLNSPISILLSFPLTLYYIMTSLHRFQDCESVFGKAVVHVVGAEKEVDILPVFTQLGMLLPRTRFMLAFIGPNIDKKAHGKQFSNGNVHAVVYSGRYEKFLRKVDSASPDLVVGFNAGLAAYRSWGKALVEMAAKKIPAYFTDYCKYSCASSRAPMEGLKLGTTSEPVINPFRSPVRIFSEENKMPVYSNAYIYHLQYNETIDRNAWALMELSKVLKSNLRLEKEEGNQSSSDFDVELEKRISGT
ncbi:zinc finger MYND domain-containing protein 15-like [Tubulanus polymorphus]|uniref:zinc finger MYND domain-containing protein 15-like n=1 Tax=Tubulanus polymorphus TaxID=672921 RepID=UPI003DA2B52D